MYRIIFTVVVWLATSLLFFIRPVTEAATRSALFHFVTAQESSSPVCRLADQSVVIKVGRSVLDCSQQCLEQHACTGFNSLATTKTCELFTVDSAEGYLTEPGCAHYKKSDICLVVTIGITSNITAVDAHNCSFPFTYNGELYYNCIQNVNNVTVCAEEYACLLSNRTWAICSSSQEYRAQNTTVNITIPTLPEQEVMMVNGWIIIQQRVDGSLSFQLPWSHYRNGFGSLGGNYWLGNEAVHQLSTATGGQYKLRMEMCAIIPAGWFSAEYWYFALQSETSYYRIELGGYSGDNGDAMDAPQRNFKYYHNGMYFSTYDNNNDNSWYNDCASWHGGGWWYNNCQDANFNGYYGVDGTFYWDPLSGVGSSIMNLTASRMMIKPIV